MTSIKHILVPTDGSEGSLHAAQVAGTLARSLDAKVTLLYVQSEDQVLPLAWGGVSAGSDTIELVRNSLEKHASEELLPKTAEALGKMTNTPDSIVIWGHSSEQICKYAKENSVDLIVIGSHGRSKLGRAFLGSVSQAVANQAPCPVTIVR